MNELVPPPGVGFEVPGDLADLGRKISDFVETEVIPFESDERWTPHGPSDALRTELNERAKRAGVFAPHVARDLGGLGLGHFGRAIAFEAAGYSMLGPVALHCAAPDEGNMHLLSVVATREQRDRFLRPLATGTVRSCFCMTEPHPGAGSDPAQLATTARADGTGYVIDGDKWMITGADGAGFAIIMAKHAGGSLDGRATMFLTELPRPEFLIERRLDSLDSSFTGGHAAVAIRGLRVPASDVLGEAGEGFRHAQLRLAPARLTHCMRWLGAARRCHDTALAHARKRTAFGKRLGDHEGVSFMLADNAIDLHATRLCVWQAAWLLDRGERASTESSMTKVFASEALFRVVDRSMQVLGALGVSGDTPVERIFRDMRSFRIYDGPSEVHRWSIGRRMVGPGQ